MPPSNQLPASLRYLRARLRPLTRPPVWGGAIFISVVGLVAWEYSVNPDLLQSSEHNAVTESKSNNPSLSPEDSAIGADIDSSPVLARELNQASTPIAPVIPPKRITTKDLLELGTEKTTSPNDTQLTPSTVSGTSVPALTPENPFLAQAQNLLQTGQLYGNGPSSGNPYATSTQINTGQTSGSSLGNGLPPAANQNQTGSNGPLLNQAPIANPASTINQGSANALGPTSPAASSIYAPPPNGISNSATGNTQATATNNTYPANSSNYPSGVQIAPSVAPYSAPPVAPAPISVAPYSTQPNQPTVNYSNPTLNSGGSSNFQQPSQLQQYFTTPSANQRRPIGGGQVNTFGNP